MILFGDFNRNWSYKAKRQKLKHVARNLEFQQVIEGPTRIICSSETLIDLSFTIDQKGRKNLTIV